MKAEYPQAIWRPSPNFRPGSPRRAVRRIVTHITDGTTSEGCLAWFESPKSRVSAHFVIGRDGRVWQCVRLADVAWHAGRANADSVGIEHVATAKLPCTPAQYRASAELQAWLCRRFGLPPERGAVLIGHSEADPRTSHTRCPAAGWDWQLFAAALATRKIG